MLQVWKIEVPSKSAAKPAAHGWALAETAEEAQMLAGVETAIVEKKPDHLWIVPQRVIWETRSMS